MATVGQSLTAPESGWKRYDDKNSIFKYNGTWTDSTTTLGYSGSYKTVPSPVTKESHNVKFDFYGTKLRLIGVIRSDASSQCFVEIDGVEYTFSEYNSGNSVYQALVFEKSNLNLGRHTVKITSIVTSNLYFFFDAIDIDDTGELLIPPVAVGEQLTAPESGWKRFDDTHPTLKRTGNWVKDTSSYITSCYNGTLSYATGDAKIDFVFSGTKLRLIANTHTNKPKNVQISIDGVVETFDISMANGYQILAYEKTGLQNKKHVVSIYSPSDIGTLNWNIDALDIDDTGEMITSISGTYPTPDTGWKRYEDNHPAISYGADWKSFNDTFGSYKGNDSSSTKVTFHFTGDKLRIVSPTNTTGSNSVNIEIDGVVETYSLNSSAKASVLVYEKTGLENKRHTASIWKTSGQLWLDAVEIDSTGRLYHPDEVTDIRDLDIGKRIRCHYQSPTSGKVGYFSGMGQETSDFIPPASSATPNGDFYFIMVENWNKKKILVTDRNIQHSISWDTLNSAGIASGSGVPYIFYDNQIKPLTSANGDAIVTCSSENPSYQAWKAFDGENTINASSIWQTGASNGLGWIQIQFTTYKPTFSAYSILATNNSSTTRSPKNWTLMGSNDGVSWDNIHTASNQTGWGNFERRVFTLDKEYSYNYIKLNVTSNNGDTTLLNLMEIGLLLPYFKKNYNFSMRLPTGGISATDKDNEWDKYIASSTLNGTITAGDNNVWNWSGIFSWTSTSVATGTRTMRGSTSSSNFGNGVVTNGVNATYGFRPVLVVETLPQTKSLFLIGGEYKKWVEAEYGSSVSYGGNAIPKMTSNTSAGGVASASSEYSGRPAYKAFDGNNATVNDGWSTNNLKTGFLQFTFNESKVIGKY